MIRNPQELTTAIKSAVNRRAVLFSHLLLFVTITFYTVLWPTITTFEIIVTILVCAGLIVLLFFKVFDLARLNNHPLVSIIAYWVLIYVGISFLSEPATPYLVAAFLGVFMSNLYYGSKGVYITVAVMAAATVTKFLFLSYTRGLTTENLLDIFTGFFVFAAICSFFVNLQTVYDWDRKRLKSLIKEATIEQKRLTTLINSMTEGVLVLDKDGRVKLANKAALDLFATDSVDGKLLSDFAKLTDTKNKSIGLPQLLPADEKPINRRDITLKYSQEDYASISISVSPLRTTFGKDDNYTGFIMTIRDITREKTLEEERNEFISVISHELRTPVTVTEGGIAAALRINQREGDNQEIKKMLTTAHNQALYLAGILNDLTTFAHTEEEDLKLDLEAVNPKGIIEQLHADHMPDASSKSLGLEMVIDNNTPNEIISNKRFISEILHNLVTNAIKYSESGIIKLSVKPSDGGVIFSVSDQGVGISTSDQKKIFDKFFRSEDYRTRSTSGTGLGLYIVRKLTQIIKADVSLQSDLGKGSTFSVSVPDLRQLLEEQRRELISSNIEASGDHQTTGIPAPEPSREAAQI